MTKDISYAELLNQDLPLKSHPMYAVWREYALASEKRGEEIALFLERYGKLSGKDIMDVGCGDGGISISLAKKGARVTGIDINQRVIERAKQRAIEEGVHVEWILKDVLDKDFHKRYDLIILYDIIEHILEVNIFARKISALMNKNGLYIYIILTNYSRLIY
jgi:2-polyprenyl-3-methyl-5-hydroxy-6-metoxy-1,4-benzoquinol methylase